MRPAETGPRAAARCSAIRVRGGRAFARPRGRGGRSVARRLTTVATMVEARVAAEAWPTLRARSSLAPRTSPRTPRSATPSLRRARIAARWRSSPRRRTRRRRKVARGGAITNSRYKLSRIWALKLDFSLSGVFNTSSFTLPPKVVSILWNTQRTQNHTISFAFLLLLTLRGWAVALTLITFIGIFVQGCNVLSSSFRCS